MKIFGVFLLYCFSVSSIAGNFYDRPLWDSREVSVCFSNLVGEFEFPGGTLKKVSKWRSKHKNTVKKWITEEYSSKRTGVYFTGFQNCEESTDSDVVVFLTKKKFFNVIKSTLFGGTNGFATGGPMLARGQINNFPNARGYIWLNANAFGKFTTVHEFGHVVGLAHEHEREEAKEDFSCKFETKGSIGYSQYKFVTPHGDYDGKSVMNYCHMNRSNGGLSAGDIETLKYLYLSNNQIGGIL